MKLSINKKNINFFSECSELHMGLWQCPPFLFLIMGLITIVSMLATYVIATKYVHSQEFVVLIVSGITALFFVVGNSIISSFSKIAEANRIKSEFVAIVSHQIRSPLSNLKWTLEAIESNVEDKKLALDSLKKSTQEIIHRFNTLLELSEIEGGTLGMRSEVISLDNLAKSKIKELNQMMREKEIAFSYFAANDIAEVVGDRDRISDVIHTFIDNSIRYSNPKGIIVVELSNFKNSVKFSVQDHGIGIPDMQKKLIFQKFYRISKPTRFKTEGMGVDLYISKYVINSLDGDIGFVSQDGKGSTFWFTLPKVRTKS